MKENTIYLCYVAGEDDAEDRAQYHQRESPLLHFFNEFDERERTIASDR